MEGQEAASTFTARVKGQPVKMLCIQPQTARAAHLVTVNQGSHEMETSLRYSEELNVAPHKSPFRPAKMGPFSIRSVEVTEQDILIVTDGGTIRLPPGTTAYSYSVD